MNKLLIEACFDGDTETKMSGVPYSTSVREIVTVGEMDRMYRDEMKRFVKLQLSSMYGKFGDGKGRIIDESI